MSCNFSSKLITVPNTNKASDALISPRFVDDHFVRAINLSCHVMLAWRLVTLFQFLFHLHGSGSWGIHSPIEPLPEVQETIERRLRPRP